MHDDFFPPKRSSGISNIFSGLVGAIIGGLLVSLFSPALAPQQGVPAQPKAAERIQGKTALPRLESNSFIDIAKKVGPAVVGISNRGSQSFLDPHPDVEQGSGSGVIFDQNGYIITNNHVVEGASELVISLANGKDIEGKLIGRDPRTDLAVVKIDPKEAGKFNVAPLGNSDKLQVGEDVVAIGNPLGLEFAGTVTRGIVSATNRQLNVGDQTFNLIQTDAAINPGNSGGALINTRGQVIGINSVKIMNERVEGLNFAIPINDARPIVDSLIKYGKVIRPWLGIKGGTLNKAEMPDIKAAVDKGVWVSEVVANGPAAQAGMQAGDVIVQVGDKKVVEFKDLLAFIKQHKIGERVKVIVNRAGKKVNLTIELGEMPNE